MRVCIGESDVVAPGRLKAKLAAVLARHGMVSARVAEVRSLRGLVEEIAALRFLDALCGDTPTIAFRPADPADPRFRLLRDLPGMGARPRADRSRGSGCAITAAASSSMRSSAAPPG